MLVARPLRAADPLFGAWMAAIGRQDELIRELVRSRERSGISKAQLSRSLNTTAGYIDRFEALETDPRVSFLLGYADSGNTQPVVNRTYSSYYYAPFVQDDWKVTPKLTVNLGLRYDLSPAPTERHNSANYAFDTTSINPVDAQINHALLPGGEPIRGSFTFAGVNGNPRSAFKVGKLGFQPRFGFAHAVNSKTVVRGGLEEMLTGFLLSYLTGHRWLDRFLRVYRLLCNLRQLPDAQP